MTGGTGTNTYLYAAAGELHANRLRHHRQLQSDPRQDRPDRHRNNRAIVPDNPSLNHCCCSIGSGWRQSGGNTFVYVNTTASSKSLGSANMEIELNHSISLTAANFLHS